MKQACAKKKKVKKIKDEKKLLFIYVQGKVASKAS
jgi:hypothetical protein